MLWHLLEVITLWRHLVFTAILVRLSFVDKTDGSTQGLCSPKTHHLITIFISGEKQPIPLVPVHPVTKQWLLQNIPKYEQQML